MLPRKVMLTGLTLVALSSPLLSHAATLDVYNGTNEDSTVRVTQSGLCSGSRHMTPAHGESHTGQGKVKILCLLAKKCSAVMYPSNNCSGNPIAALSIDTDSMNVTIDSIMNPHYTVVASGNRVDIGYAG